jgi:CspA family cold shock protein
MNGKIKWFNPTKGYGFIAVEGRGDVFLHVSALEKANISELQIDDEMEFDIGENNGKETAINVKRLQ